MISDSWRSTYNDWHRVEQTLARFVREVDDLRDQGWVEA
jgi:hypothetical protein